MVRKDVAFGGYRVMLAFAATRRGGLKPRNGLGA